MAETETTTPPTQQPVRLLLETETHLVPGKFYMDKVNFLRNIVCNRHVNRDYIRKQDRMYIQGDEFAFAHRRCFMLVDIGSRDAVDVPIVRYRWTGTEIIHIEEPLTKAMTKELARWPFAGRPWKRSSNSSPVSDRRSFIKVKIKTLLEIIPSDLIFLRDNPSQWQRIKNGFSKSETEEIADTLERLDSAIERIPPGNESMYNGIVYYR